jgi:hypothetical protein
MKGSPQDMIPLKPYPEKWSVGQRELSVKLVGWDGNSESAQVHRESETLERGKTILYWMSYMPVSHCPLISLPLHNNIFERKPSKNNGEKLSANSTLPLEIKIGEGMLNNNNDKIFK